MRIRSGRLFSFVFLFLAAFFFANCGCTKVEAGYVGVKVNLLGSEKGVQAQEVGVGRYLLGINEELYLFPTFSTTQAWTRGSNPELGSSQDEAILIQTGDGLISWADVAVQFSIEPSSADKLFQRWRKGLDGIVDGPIKNSVRDTLNMYAASLDSEKLAGTSKTELLQKVERDIRATLLPDGIRIERIYWLSPPKPPEEILARISEKVQARQRAETRENELREATAQAAKEKVLAQARLAESNSITPTLVKYKELEVKKILADKWNGQLPQWTGNAIPFIDTKSLE